MMRTWLALEIAWVPSTRRVKERSMFRVGGVIVQREGGCSGLGGERVNAKRGATGFGAKGRGSYEGV